jgi:hypothetical protein
MILAVAAAAMVGSQMHRFSPRVPGPINRSHGSNSPTEFLMQCVKRLEIAESLLADSHTSALSLQSAMHIASLQRAPLTKRGMMGHA